MINNVGYLFHLLIQTIFIVGMALLIINKWGDWNVVNNRFSKIANKIMSIISSFLLLGMVVFIFPKPLSIVEISLNL
ncbi:MAG: hypothetical protein Q8900_02380 [Bacillota bacterium]|nr:hypothetical protein [Bacillota bacterium]